MTFTDQSTEPRAEAHKRPALGGDPRKHGPGKRLSLFVHRHIVGVFTAPAVVFIVTMMAFPVAYTAWLSLHDWTGSATVPPRFIGIDNFVRLLTDDPRFIAAFMRTFVLTGMAVTAQTILGVALALLLHRQFVIRGLVRSIVLAPMIATPVAIALVWRLMYQPQVGILNEILTSIGLSPLEWASSSSTVLLALAIVDIWEWTPLITLITLAGLVALPDEPMEAAAVDGATPWQRFWYVTLPMLRPVIVIAVVFRLIEALKTFDIILVITQGGPGFSSETLNIYAYNQAFQYQRLGYAAALLIVYFLIILFCAGVLLRFRRAKD